MLLDATKASTPAPSLPDRKGRAKSFSSTTPIGTPFVIQIDGREQAPYLFTGLRTDASRGNRPLEVAWEWAKPALPTGDYSIRDIHADYRDRIAIERKSLQDLYSTLGSDRDRFEREHERMAEIAARPGGWAEVVIEATWPEILQSPPEQSRLNPKTVYRTMVSWSMRYGVHWTAVGPRRLAEVHVFRRLEMWWRVNGRENG